ncbi:hypothetical protein DLS45_13950, partial [Staphylococcus pseudintermedius]|uniref:hypothetical protein n=1 Tax=Staphylococcus pseudintermedius TaxID=283734 RepID=UPI0010D114A7
PKIIKTIEEGPVGHVHAMDIAVEHYYPTMLEYDPSPRALSRHIQEASSINRNSLLSRGS